MPHPRTEYARWQDELSTTPTTPLPVFKWASWALVLATVAAFLTFLFAHTGG